jgi:hypothetical protein
VVLQYKHWTTTVAAAAAGMAWVFLDKTLDTNFQRWELVLVL